MNWLFDFLGSPFITDSLGIVWADVIGFVTGVICLYLLGKGNIWNFGFGIASMLCYAFVTWRWELYANFGLAWIFVVLNIYGWITWSRSKDEDYNAGIIHTPTKWRVPLVAAGVAMMAGLLVLLRSSSSHVWLDSLTTSLSLLAQFMIARKFVENWWLWLVADVFYIALFFTQQAWTWLALYVIYTFLSAKGLREWTAAARANRMKAAEGS